MADRRSRVQHERQAARDKAARDAAGKADRRRRLLAIAAVIVVLMAVVGTLYAAATGKGDTNAAAPTSTTASLPGVTTSTATGPPPVPIPADQAGGALSGPTPCPAENGSSPRITLFTGPPPQCIDKAKQYNAIIDTSVGPLTLSLYMDLAPGAVNNLAVLARYHYWDGLPLSSITARGTMKVAADLTTNGRPSPGYTLPGEFRQGGIIITPGMLAFAPVDTANQIGGTLLMALGDKAANLPTTTTIVGLLLDGTDALAAINRAGSGTGAPGQVITIKSVRVIQAPASTTTTTH